MRPSSFFGSSLLLLLLLLPPSCSALSSAGAKIRMQQARTAISARHPRAAVRMDAAAADFTEAAVDKVLDEVRPYLISDGGNVRVVSVDPDSMTVSLELEGACGDCPSSTTTMKMGIERLLKEKWPSLSEIIEINNAVGGLQEKVLDIGTAIDALSSIMPAIAGLGGSVRVVTAADGKVELEYTGPEKIKLGIELALKDSPLIEEVVFVEREV